MDIKEVLTNLCYYDLRNPEGLGEYKHDLEAYGYEMSDVAPKETCYCDNCHYGRTPMAGYILKLINYKEDEC